MLLLRILCFTDFFNIICSVSNKILEGISLALRIFVIISFVVESTIKTIYLNAFNLATSTSSIDIYDAVKVRFNCDTIDI